MQPGVVTGAVFEFVASRAYQGLQPGVNSPLTTSAFDTSGNGNHGTLTSFAGTTTSGWDGSGTTADPYRLVFGTGNYVALPDLSAAEDKTFTYEVWVADSQASTVDYRVCIAEWVDADAPLVWLGLGTAGDPITEMYGDAWSNGAVTISSPWMIF